MKNLTGIAKKALSLVITLAFIQFTVLPAAYAEELSVDAKTYSKLKKELKAEIYAEIRTEIYEEFNANINQLVADNVRRELRAYIAQQVIQSRVEQQAFHRGDRPALLPGERLDYAVQRTVQEIFQSGQLDQYLSDEELDSIAAGSGIEADLPIQGGYAKTPKVTPSLLARGRGQATSMTKADYNLAAGEMRQESIERTLQSKGSILLPKGTVQVEPSFTWAHFSSNRINIQGFSILPVLVIGDISVQETRRDIFISSLAVKYGLLNNLQAEVSVPFRGQKNRDTTSESDETTDSTYGLGDVSVGLSRQIAWESGIVPDLIAAVTFKTKTGDNAYEEPIGLGTGHYSIRGSLIAAKSSDPAVVFGSLSYTYNFKENYPGLGDVEPGSTIGYSLGMAIALSYQTAINFSFDHSITEKFQVGGRLTEGSFLNSANVKIGANWAINERSSVDFSVAFGVTDDAPDVTAEIRFPFVF